MEPKTPLITGAPEPDPAAAAPNLTSGSGRKRKGWSKKNALMTIIVIAGVWLASVQLLAADRYQAVVNVIEGTDTVGVNPSAERLDFGDLSRDTGASRFVNLKNPGKMAKTIVLVKSGKIAELMKADKPAMFTLRPGEEAKIEFNVKIPVSAPYGQYAGTVMIFKWPKVF